MYKKILFANGRPAPPITFGGDSVAINILSQYLNNKIYRCFGFGTLNPEYSNRYNLHNTSDIKLTLKKLKIPYKFSKSWLHFKICGPKNKHYLAIKRSIDYNIPFQSRLVRTEFFYEELELYIQKIHPDLIITQVDCIEDVVALAKKYNIPLIFIIQDLETYNLRRIAKVNMYKNSTIIFISKAIERRFAHQCKVPTHLWYHPLNIKEQGFITNSKDGYITMINPVLIKGGETFHDIALAMPNEKFLAVINWNDPKNEGIDFSDTKNVSIIARTDDMNTIYKKTKLLLVPSLWQEGFGRVAIEAGSHGIPTIASDSGGLSEAVGRGGIIIKNYIDTKQWVNAIKKIFKKDNYKRLCKQALRNSLLFSTDIQGRKFEQIMSEILNNS